MKNKILLLPVLILAHVTLNAQKGFENLSKGYIYNKEKGIDVRVHTSRGWDVYYTTGDIKTYFKTTYWRYGIGELRHYKETTKSSDAGGFLSQQGYSSYTYGKQNFCFPLRVSYGVKRYYTEKATRNGVALAVNYSGGLTAAILKPYYLEVSQGRDQPLTYIKYSDETATIFLDNTQNTNVRGSANFFKGFNEVSVMPGIHAQAGVHLDWGAFDEVMKAVEAGVMLDVFPKKLAIMANQENLPFFLNFYISVQLGMRN